MKRIIVMLSILFLGTVWQSCRKEHFLINDISFHLAEIKVSKKDKRDIEYTCTSTVKDKLVFVISYHTEYVTQNYLNIGSSCYAMTLGKIIDNPLHEESFSLKFDKPFNYNGKNIVESTNIFEIGDIRKEIETYENFMSFCGMTADKVIDFNQLFLKNAIFEKTEHEVTFSCETSDGITFTKKITINFE